MAIEYRIFLRDGFILDEVIQENIIGAARRGKVTPLGEKLVLTPHVRSTDRRGKLLPPDVSGFYQLEPVKKKDCIPLKSFSL